MAKNKLDRMLAAPDKEVKKTSGANGVLARLFRIILLNLNVTPSRFGSLLQQYILDPRNQVPNNKKDQTSARGNLTKEFYKPQMTWKVFLKAMRFLRVWKLVFIVELHHSGPANKTTLHSTEVNLGDPGMIEALEQLDDGMTIEQEMEEVEELKRQGLGVQYLDSDMAKEQNKEEE